jgi:opacity protein-like surface antigen
MKQINHRLIFRLAFCATLVLGVVTFVSAQTASKDEYPKFEFFVGPSAIGEVNSPGISFGPSASISSNYAGKTGFETSLTGNFRKRFGIKADFSAHFNNSQGHGAITSCTPTCTTATQDSQLKKRVYNFLAGPEFKARNSSRFTPFVYALAGVAHTSVKFTTPGPTFNLLLKKSNNSFAMALGGGLDFRISKRVSFRGTMDYNPVFVRDSNTGTRDLVRISAGLLFH